MDFKNVLDKLLSSFADQGIHYALIGGFALGLWGVDRTTADLDFLILRDDMEKVDRILTDIGYNRTYGSENVSHYTAPQAPLGGIDILHAFREASRAMLERAVNMDVFDGILSMKVVRPDDLIGLKVQAIANDARRRTMDLADIEALMARHSLTLDWQLIGDYFSLFEMDGLFRDLERNYHAQPEGS